MGTPLHPLFILSTLCNMSHCPTWQSLPPCSQINRVLNYFLHQCYHYLHLAENLSLLPPDTGEPPKATCRKRWNFFSKRDGGRGISHPNHLNIWKVSWDPLWRKILTFSRRSVGILCWWREIITWSRRSFGTLRWWRKMITFQGELGPPVGKEK